MKPKKRDKSTLEESKPKFEQIQNDHELFLQAFEKPTQIYRYLRTRNLISPIFLNRSLSYLKGRCLRKKGTRRNFKLSQLLDEVDKKHKKDHHIHSYKSEFLNLTFTGFFDKELHGTELVDVETSLVKMCHKKRKDVSSPIMQVNLGTIKVACNPECVTPSKAQALAVASSHFMQSNGHAVRSYVLLIRVTCNYNVHAAHPPGMCNGDASPSEKADSSSDEPVIKRRKSSRGVPESPMANGNTTSNHCDSKEEKESREQVLYGAELVIYDRHRRCQLTDGDYEVALQDLSEPEPPKAQATWETVLDGKVVAPFEVFNKLPTLKFKLNWNKEPLHGVVESPEPLRLLEEQSTNTALNNHRIPSVLEKDLIPRNVTDRTVSPRKRRIFYQFMYNNNTRQQTEAREDLHCPWCSLNCLHLYGLLKHLRTCHSRFNFTYVEHPKGARIDVSINACYDGSYAGNPQDLHSHIGFAFSRTGPVRRTPVNELIVYRPKRPEFKLSEFQEPENETHAPRQFVQGHNRLYYHTITQQPIRPQEIDIDSEAEVDPIWLQQKTAILIDEFTDVNEGEKEIMKMWNLHVMHHNYIGDCQLPTACQTFVEEYGERILKGELSRNLLLHLVSLYDFGLIRPDLIYQTMWQLYSLYKNLQASGRKLPELARPSLANITLPSIPKTAAEPVSTEMESVRSPESDNLKTS